MRPQLLAGLVTLALGVTGCTTPIRTGMDYDKQAVFQDYGSFAWISENPLIAPDGQFGQVSPLTLSRIRTAIADSLIEKGYEKIKDPAAADFVVAFTVGTRDKVEITSYPTAYRGHWGWRGPWIYDSEIRARTYTEGSLAIDIFDGPSKQPVWHGWARKNIEQADIDDPETVIRQAVEAIFQEFPPPMAGLS